MSQLTPREKEIVAIIHQEPSITVRGIARKVDNAYRPGERITNHGVQFHLSNAYRKLQVNSRAELVAKLCQERS